LKFSNVSDKSTIIELSSDSTKFRLMMIKSYYDDDHFKNSSLFNSIIDFSFIESASLTKSSNMSLSNDQFAVSNDQESEFEILSNSFKRDSDQFWKYLPSIAFLNFVFNTIVDSVFASISLFVFVVVFKLDLIVHITLFQFVAFKQKEINELIEKNVF
jgi:hypothetical protein